MTIIYKLYEDDRCFGDIKKRKEVLENRLFICEDSNMIRLINYVHINGNWTKTYIILKYVDDDVKWRQLQKQNKYGCDEHGDLSTTWYKIIYEPNKMTWKESIFRYNDEKIILYDEKDTKYYLEMQQNLCANR